RRSNARRRTGIFSASICSATSLIRSMISTPCAWPESASEDGSLGTDRNCCSSISSSACRSPRKQRRTTVSGRCAFLIISRTLAMSSFSTGTPRRFTPRRDTEKKARPPPVRRGENWRRPRSGGSVGRRRAADDRAQLRLGVDLDGNLVALHSVRLRRKHPSLTALDRVHLDLLPIGPSGVRVQATANHDIALNLALQGLVRGVG